MLSKPCGRGGCTGTVVKARASDLERTSFCGKRCAYIERLRGGWDICAKLRGQKRPTHVMEAARVGRMRAFRKRRALVAAQLFDKLAPADVKASLELRSRDLAAVRQLLVRAVEYGHRLGRLARNAEERKGRAAA